MSATADAKPALVDDTDDLDNEPCVVAIGTPFDPIGMRLYGPFANVDDATDWADDTIDDASLIWEIVELDSPTAVEPLV